MIEIKTCQYKNHPAPLNSLCHYWDDDHGIDPNGIKMCRECYAEHILKYYPDSQIGAHIKANPDEYINSR